MSKNKKDTQNTEQKPEKIVTKYDLKMERRRKEKEKEKRDRLIGRIVGTVVVAALVCFVASFPIRTYLTVHGTYITVAGYNISKVEFDYYHSRAKLNHLSQYGSFYAYLGMDVSTIEYQMYSETLSYSDYFDQMAVDMIAEAKGLLLEAEAEGYTYDTAGEYREYMEALEEAAAEEGMSKKAYIQELYGAYATESRVKPFIEEGMLASAYYQYVAERMIPTQEEIEAYYNENKDAYDSVDYYVYTVEAELPTEPTELADPVEETEETEEDGAIEEEPYVPSEAEVEAAMAKAGEEAERIARTIDVNGELITGARRLTVSVLLQREWLFDQTRVAGDNTIIEDSTNNRYYVLKFVDRYLDQSRSADIHVVMTADGNGQAILEEWQNGEATEESFAELCDKYNDSSITTAEGGLYEALVSSSLPEELQSWIFDSARVAGETTVITPEDDAYSYVLYYVAPNREEWVLDIESILVEDRMLDYMDEVLAKVTIQDPKHNLAYLYEQGDDSWTEDDGSAVDEGDSSDGSTAEGEDSSDSSAAEGE